MRTGAARHAPASTSYSHSCAHVASPSLSRAAGARRMGASCDGASRHLGTSATIGGRGRLVSRRRGKHARERDAAIHCYAGNTTGKQTPRANASVVDMSVSAETIAPSASPIPAPMFTEESEFAASPFANGAQPPANGNGGDLERLQIGFEEMTKARDEQLKSILEPVGDDFEEMRRNLLKIVGSRHPMLVSAAEEIFGAGGKRVRPMLSLLVARATIPITGMADINDKHRRLAEIMEMIHTASLVHDDVLDECELRRGKPTTVAAYGTRFAVLAGDFLFAQSSWFLANLDNLEVIKLISQVIADFADGEIAQAQKLFDASFTMEDYTQKNFYKTASLIAAGCRGAAVFSEASEEIKDAMYEYGRHLGLAFQIVDDILDFTTPDHLLGKPAGQDLAQGNLTAPALFALRLTADVNGDSRLKDLVNMGFKHQEDLDEALSIIDESGAYEAARILARREGDIALEQLDCLPESESKESLRRMVDYVLERLY